MRIALDLKNLALYQGGISHWTKTFLPTWIESHSSYEFSGIIPIGANLHETGISNIKKCNINWPEWLSKSLRHPYYDNFLFPGAIRKVRPNLIFSPYHDVRLSDQIPAVITVHDLCYLDVAKCFPWHLREYYIRMLKYNLLRAKHIITVSNATKNRLIHKLKIDPKNISIVPNALDEEFFSYTPSAIDIVSWRANLKNISLSDKLVLYPGGIDYRKNIPRLMSAMRQLWSEGEQITLLITGFMPDRWQHLFPELITHPNRVQFLGFLTSKDLRITYESVDCVIYPSLSEGFGRVCIEAMATGAPLACSNLDALGEVAGDYPLYFDPESELEITQTIRSALLAGRQPRRLVEGYAIKEVCNNFINALQPILQSL